MQLVIRTINQYDGADAQTIATSTERGDVIEVVPDDHQWGRLDLTNPDWVVLRVDIDEAEALASKVGEDPEGIMPAARIRAVDVDLDFLAGKYKGIPTAQEARDVRDRYKAQAQAQGILESQAKHDPMNALATAIVDVFVEDFRAAIKQKPPISDRMIIG
jgi:hypothetical protein